MQETRNKEIRTIDKIYLLNRIRDEFVTFVHRYNLDIITISETWLKNKKIMLDYVEIDGYEKEFRIKLSHTDRSLLPRQFQ